MKKLCPGRHRLPSLRAHLTFTLNRCFSVFAPACAFKLKRRKALELSFQNSKESQTCSDTLDGFKPSS
jgi:hypothetical protein